MSALIGHAKAARILGGSFTETGANCERPETRTIMFAIGVAYDMAAERMEEAMRQEATAWTPPLPSDGLGK